VVERLGSPGTGRLWRRIQRTQHVRRIGVEAFGRRQRTTNERYVLAQAVATNPAAVLPNGSLKANGVHHPKIDWTIGRPVHELWDWIATRITLQTSDPLRHGLREVSWHGSRQNLSRPHMARRPSFCSRGAPGCTGQSPMCGQYGLATANFVLIPWRVGWCYVRVAVMISDAAVEAIIIHAGSAEPAVGG
jgi:hypothetical protein